MEKGFYRVETRRVDDSSKRSDSFTFFVPLSSSGQLDPDGEGPPYRFEAVWDGEKFVGEFKERASQKQNVLVWAGIENGDCQTDLLTVPLSNEREVCVFDSSGVRRTYRVTGIRITK